MIIIKDSTMREGLDVPGVAFGTADKRRLLLQLAEAGVREAELVAPGRFDQDLRCLPELGCRDSGVKASGLIFAGSGEFDRQAKKAQGLLDRLDILMPLSHLRPPSASADKLRRLTQALRTARGLFQEVGVGFPHSLQVERSFLLEICEAAVANGASRLTIYDTNGAAYPWNVAGVIKKVKVLGCAELCFHAHNDLGMATANAVTAVWAGANVLDVTVNGLGDRAGNASLEQVALALELKGVSHGLVLKKLRELSRQVETMSGVPIPKLAPVVGDFAFSHKSPKHLDVPGLFEAFDPEWVGAERELCRQKEEK